MLAGLPRALRCWARSFRVKIKIREQLSILVALTAVTAVGVLSLIFWVNNRRLIQNVSSSRFSLTAALKTAQISQAFEILHQCAYSISTRVTLRYALDRYTNQGNNTAENWKSATQELLSVASSNYGGYQEILQIVVWDAFLSDGSPGVPNGTVVDSVVVGGSNYTGLLPNGTRLNVGVGIGGRLGLVNVTGDNALGIELPPSASNGWKAEPMKIPDVATPLNDTSDVSVAREEAEADSDGGEDGFPDELYPVPNSVAHGPEVGNQSWIFSPEYIMRFGGLMLGPMMVNQDLALISYTLPVYGPATSASSTDVVGFVTVTLNAQPLLDIINESRGLGKTGETVLVGPATINNLFNDTRISRNKADRTPATDTSSTGVDTRTVPEYALPTTVGSENTTIYVLKKETTHYKWRYMLPPRNHPTLVGQEREFRQYHAVWNVYVDGPQTEGDGGQCDLDAVNSEGELIGVGYAQPLRNANSDNLTDWALLFEEARYEAFEPISKLQKLLLAAVFGTFAGVMLVVWPIAHMSVRPITRLKQATEETTRPYSSSDDSADDHDNETSSEAQSQIDHAEKGRPRIVSYFTNLAKRRRSSAQSDERDGTSDPRRRFRIPGKVRERRHIIHDELTSLTKTFNAMSDELELQYTTLEERVFERTEELRQEKAFAEEQRQRAEAQTMVAEEQKQVAEEQRKIAEEANEAKSLFIANISHELRTPLNAIINMCDVAMDQASEMPNIRRSLEIASVSGKSLLHLITELLTFSKNQVGQVAETVSEEEFCLNGLKTQIMAIFEKMASDKAITLEMGLQPPRLADMVLLGDGNRLAQVLINLVSNSLKFTPRGGRVQVQMSILHDAAAPFGSRPDPSGEIKALHKANTGSTIALVADDATVGQRVRDERVLEQLPDASDSGRSYMLSFKVTDNGSGIPEKMQKRVFEPFIQADMCLSYKTHEGVGLGLSICKQIAKMLHGSISLCSEEGKGSTFTMVVPLKFVRYQDAEYGRNNRPHLGVGRVPQPYFPPSSPNTTPGGHNLFDTDTPESGFDDGESGAKVPRVLVAEDNPTNRTVIAQMLKIQKLRNVTMAHDGLQALEKMKTAMANNEVYSVVLMDIQMPHLDGIACTKQARGLGYKGPVVALTAYADDANQRMCLEAGMDGFLVKPIVKTKLKEVLDIYAWRRGDASLPMTPWADPNPSPPNTSKSLSNGTASTVATTAPSVDGGAQPPPGEVGPPPPPAADKSSGTASSAGEHDQAPLV